MANNQQCLWKGFTLCINALFVKNKFKFRKENINILYKIPYYFNVVSLIVNFQKATYNDNEIGIMLQVYISDISIVVANLYAPQSFSMKTTTFLYKNVFPWNIFLYLNNQ